MPTPASNQHFETPVTVIGAGLAGMLCSLWLDKQGVSHIIVDAKDHPREKACGDIITSNAIRRLNEISPDILTDLAAMGHLLPIKGTLVFPPNHKSITLDFKDLDGKAGVHSCYSIERHHLDPYLMERIFQSANARAMLDFPVQKIEREGDRFQVRSKTGKRISSKLVIAATGSNSPVCKQLVPQNKESQHIAVGIRAYYKGVDSRVGYGEVVLDKRTMPGGLYITSLQKDVFNVNLVMRSDVVKKKNINMRQAFEDLLQHNELLQHKFRNATQVGDFKGSSLYLGTQKRQLSGDGFMLAGDAAGLIDLISANGIPQAMLSGKLAAMQAVQCLETHNFSASFMRSYDQSLYRRIKSDLALGRLVNPILHTSIVQNTSLAILNMVANDSGKSSSITDLFYSKNPLTNLVQPAFYNGLRKEYLAKARR